MARVSILMNCYNSERFLSETIDSVINQTFSDWEIIFWDNCSTDNSAQIVKSYHDPRIKYYLAPTHTTLYAARNAAMHYCSGEYLAFLDCDDLWSANKLSKQVDVLDNNPDVVLVYSNTIFFNSETGSQKVLNKKPQLSGDIFEKNFTRYSFSLETVVVRMRTIENHNLSFGSSYNLIGDRDFLSMICFYGKAYYIDETLGMWRMHANNFSKSLSENYKAELRTMYIRFINRFGEKITRNMRINLYNEMVFRNALAHLEEPGSVVRKKLRKGNIFYLRGLFLRLLSYFPKRFARFVISYLKRT